jgi:hypothetical protein
MVDRGEPESGRAKVGQTRRKSEVNDFPAEAFVLKGSQLPTPSDTLEIASGRDDRPSAGGSDDASYQEEKAEKPSTVRDQTSRNSSDRA